MGGRELGDSGGENVSVIVSRGEEASGSAQPLVRGAKKSQKMEHPWHVVSVSVFLRPPFTANPLTLPVMEWLSPLGQRGRSSAAAWELGLSPRMNLEREREHESQM